MQLEVISLTLGMVDTNAYLIGDLNTKRAILIDPVDNADVLLKTAQDKGWEIALVLATHAHFDHVLASKAIQESTGAPFWIHRDCVEWLESLPLQGKRFGLGNFPEAAVPDRLLDNNSEIIEIDDIKLKTLYTPGHAPGHLSFYMEDENILFSGDTLFAGSIGRTDLPGGDFELLMESISKQLMTLPDETTVLAGHMEATTIGQERHNNPFLLSYRG